MSEVQKTEAEKQADAEKRFEEKAYHALEAAKLSGRATVSSFLEELLAEHRGLKAGHGELKGRYDALATKHLELLEKYAALKAKYEPETKPSTPPATPKAGNVA